MQAISKGPLLKWLIYGHTGWIGKKLCACLEDKGWCVVLAHARADDPVAVSTELDDVKPDRVVSAIGRMHGPGTNSIGWLEQPGHLVDNVRDNLFGPIVLAQETKKRGIHLTYFGSGCIFNSTDSDGNVTVFNEDDISNFTDSDYATVKGTTDRLMKYFEENVLNCRVRIPIAYDHSPRNFVTKIIGFKKIHSATNSLTVLDDMLPIIVDMATGRLTGTYNMTNPGAMSHNEVLTLYKEIVDKTFKWENFSEEEVRVVLKGARSNCLLDTSKLEKQCPAVLPLEDAVRKAFMKMAEQNKS